MPEHTIVIGVDHALGWIALQCFFFASVTSFIAQSMQTPLPPIRILVATGLYTGCSSVAVAFLWIGSGDIKQIPYLYFLAILCGLGTPRMLSGVWNRAIPAVMNSLLTSIGKFAVPNEQSIVNQSTGQPIAGVDQPKPDVKSIRGSGDNEPTQ